MSYLGLSIDLHITMHRQLVQFDARSIYVIPMSVHSEMVGDAPHLSRLAVGI